MEIKIDTERRASVKRLHTTTHIVNYSAREVLGNHVWQNGSNIRENFATLDITHYKTLSFDEIQEIEKRANKIVFENRKVNIDEIDRDVAEQKYGFTIYQGGAIPMKKIRIISIDNNDIEACGGLHVSETKEISLIKIYKTEKIQDGLIRLYFKNEILALKEFQKYEHILNELKELYNVSYDNISKTSVKFFEQWKSLEKEKKKYEKEIFELHKKLIKNANGEYNIGVELPLNLLTDIIKSTNNNVTIKTEKFILTTEDYKPKQFKKNIKQDKINIYIL